MIKVEHAPHPALTPGTAPKRPRSPSRHGGLSFLARAPFVLAALVSGVPRGIGDDASRLGARSLGLRPIAPPAAALLDLLGGVAGGCCAKGLLPTPALNFALAVASPAVGQRSAPSIDGIPTPRPFRPLRVHPLYRCFWWSCASSIYELFNEVSTEFFTQRWSLLASSSWLIWGQSTR